MQVLESQSNLIEVEQTLSKNAYFSRSPLPGFADAVIYRFLLDNKRYPDKNMYPNFYHWYIVMRQFDESAFEGWIKEKRYIDNQSEKCLMLISEIFVRQGRNVLQQSNRKKSLDPHYVEEKRDKALIQTEKLQPIDQNFVSELPQRAEYSMIVELRAVENIEELFNNFYRLKIKIKELTLRKKDKSIFLKFICETGMFDEIREEIEGWTEVRHVISKLSKTLKEIPADRRKLMRAVTIR